MAEHVESIQPVTGEESEQLKSRLEKLCNELSKVSDSNLLPDRDRDELGEIFHVLEKIKAKMPPQGDHGKEGNKQESLPVSKREELATLLPAIEGALEKRKPGAGHDPAAETKTPAALVSGCNPFKLRSSHQGSKQQQQQQGEGDAVSLKLLLRLAQHVLEPEQYYEWTTSYVDEERIFGWSEEAEQVANALVAPDDDKDGGDQKLVMFRAAGIAGVHGSGKTALARKVFVHDKAKDNFPLRLWVCVGPPDPEDRLSLLYRMLDNLGLDTAKVEDIVDNSNAVKPRREAELTRLNEENAIITDLKSKAAKMAAIKDAQKEETGVKNSNPDDVKEVDTKPAGDGEDAKKKEEEERIFQELLKEKADSCAAVQNAKIGVLLYIMHMTLSKTGYLIVFDDIRAYDGADGWYSNLSLLPPAEGEWGDRLAYGLPKTTRHRSAVLVTCRKEDDARTMVRTGRVFRPPRMGTEHGWALFKREFKEAAKKLVEDGKRKKGEEDALLNALEQMKGEIVDKCLGLPVAIAEAARGFALSDCKPPSPEDASNSLPPETAADKPLVQDRTAAASGSSKKDTQQDDKEEEDEETEPADKSED